MKKLIMAAAVVAAVGTMALASCGNDVEQDSVTVDLPKVTLASGEQTTTTTGSTTTGTNTTATAVTAASSSTTETDEDVPDEKDTETTTAEEDDDDVPTIEPTEKPTEAPAEQSLNKTSFGTGDLGQAITSVISNPDVPENVSACIPRGDEGGSVYRYKYGSDLIFDCYSSGGVKYIANVYIYSSSYTLDNGLTIGSSKDSVIAAYGEPASSGNYMLYSLGDKEIYFGLNGDTVSEIQINFA